MENKILQMKVAVISWILTIIVILILWAFDHTFVLSKGFLLGSVVSLFGFSLMNKNSVKIIETQNPKKAYSGYFIRFLLSAIVLLFVYFNSSSFNLITTFCGLFTVKISLMGYLLFRKGVVSKND